MKMVSEHFDLREFIPKEVYDVFGEKSTRFIDPNLVVVCEWLRVTLGKSITINNWHTGGQYNLSGFRPPDCPTGAKLSSHKRGTAADIKVAGMTPKQVLKYIQDHWKELRDMGLSTVENPDATPTWLHISVEWTDLDVLVIVNP